MREGIDWEKQYLKLGEFIAGHSEIVIKKGEVSVPQNLRSDFYRHFDDVRRAVVLANYSSEFLDAEALSRKYVQLEKEIRELLGLEAIRMPVDLYSFLHNPKEGLARAIYSPLFESLQAEASLEEFGERMANDLQSAAEGLFRLGYQFWAALLLIKLLEPDEAFSVALDQDHRPCAKGIKDISFGRQVPHQTLRIPEFLIHSRKLNQYVAFKMPPMREMEMYVARDKPPIRPRKETGDTSTVLDSRALILCFMPSLENIPVLVDIYEWTGTDPHWIIETIRAVDLEDADTILRVKQHKEALNPKLGACLIVMDGEYEDGRCHVPDGVRTVAMGFDTSKLQAVVDELAAKV